MGVFVRLLVNVAPENSLMNVETSLLSVKDYKMLGTYMTFDQNNILNINVNSSY